MPTRHHATNTGILTPVELRTTPSPSPFGRGWVITRQHLFQLKFEIAFAGLALLGRVPHSSVERERRSPLFSLSGNDPVCHPHAGLVCLGGCFTVTTGAFFYGDSSQQSITWRASSNPCLLCAENNFAVTDVSEHAAVVSRNTRCASR